MDEFIKFKLSIETRLLRETESTNAALDTSNKKDVYGVVVTLWGASIGFLQSLERHATSALTKIIGGSGNMPTLDNKRVSRMRFSDTDCSVEVSAVPIVEATNSKYFSDKKLARVTPSSTRGETVLNHEIVKLFVNGVVSGGYTFHGIRRLPSTPINVEVLRLEIAIKHDVAAPAAAPTGGGGDEDDDGDDGEDDTRPKYRRARSQKSRNAQLAKQLKEKARKKPARKKGKDAKDPGSSSNDAKPVPGAPATTEPDEEGADDADITMEELFGEDDADEEEDPQTNDADEEEDPQTKELRELFMLEDKD
jgi:hypothetical protein